MGMEKRAPVILPLFKKFNALNNIASTLFTFGLPFFMPEVSGNYLYKQKKWSLLCPFLKTKRIAQIFFLSIGRGDVLIVFTYELNFSFKMWFQRVFTKKTPKLKTPLLWNIPGCAPARGLLTHLVSLFVCSSRIIVDAITNSQILCGILLFWISLKILIRYGVVVWFISSKN